MPWLALVLLPLLVSAAIAGASAAPWLPTRQRERHSLLSQISFTGVQTVIDLGCGDGTVLFAIARRYPNIQAIGYDISLVPLIIGWTRKLLSPRAYCNVHLRFKNLFFAPLAGADLVFVFLLAKAYKRLVAKCKNELPNHARLVVEAWPLPDLVPSETLRNEQTLPVFVYRKAALG